MALRLAADQGNDRARLVLATFYEQGRGGLLRNAAEAVRYYQQAARAGNTDAQNRLTQLGRSW